MMRLFIPLFLLSSNLVQAVALQPYPQRLFQRLVGGPLQLSSPTYARMQNLLDKGDLMKAAEVAVSDKRFYALRVRGMAAPWTNKEADPNETFNDVQAMLIGVVRDELDARLLLTGNFKYQGYTSLGLATASRANNAHYSQFEERGLDYWANLTKSSPQWSDVSEAAGVLTSRGWAKAFYSMGTNRRAVEYTFQVFLCAPQTKWAEPGLPDSYVRRDVDRAKGGNPVTYQTHCRNCHASMDAMGGAFARLDFLNDEFVHVGMGKVAEKFNINKETFPDGYVTERDNWVNYAIYHQNESFGWRGKLEGNGVKEFGTMIANAKGFSRCLVTKVFKEVCNRGPETTDNDLVNKLTDKFEAEGYNMKKLFMNVAVEDSCIPHK